ncbi:MAG: ABC transporter permease, partial [Paracoccaceae bacterium]
MRITGDHWFSLLGKLVVALCLLPIIAVAIAALSGGFDTIVTLSQSVLPRYAGATLQLSVIVVLGTAVIGTGAAWLVTMTRFFGRRVLEIALALPLAFPAYVLAYAYTDLLDHPGLVQSTMRAFMGWGPRDYWFPEIRSLSGAAAMLVLVLYPYVYLLARAAFLRQSATAYIAARTLGKGPWSAFLSVSLPIARPAIAGGVLLALMETLADYGTTAYFGVQTFATGIYVSWFG